MDKQEAVALVKRSLPKFAAAGLPPLSVEAIAAVQPKRITSLWAGMGSVWQLNVSTSTAGAPPLSIRGRVLDAEGQPVGGVKVWIADPTYFGVIDKCPT